MKHVPPIILVSCILLLALWFFAELPAIRETGNRGMETDGSPSIKTSTPEASARAGYPTFETTSSKTGQNQAEIRYSNSAPGVWEGFSGRVNHLAGRPGQGTASGSRSLPRQESVKMQNWRAGDRTEGQTGELPSISGRVLDEAGHPVLGMEINAQPVRLFQAPEGTIGTAPVAGTISNEYGSYRFDQLQAGEYRIRTMATDRYLPAEIVVRAGVQSADLVVSGERPLSLQGQVKDTQGKTLQGVRVISTLTPSPEAATDRSGSYRLQVPVTRSTRNFVLKFQLAGYREESRQLSESQIFSSDTVRVDARMTAVKAMASVTGRVTNREGIPLSGEAVYLSGSVQYRAVTNQAGEFVLAEVEAEQSYSLRVPARSPYRPFVQQIRVGSGDLRQNVVEELGSPESGTLSGRMMDAAGNSLPLFSLWLQSYNPAARELVQATSDESGRFVLEEVPLGNLNFTTRSQPRLLISGLKLTESGLRNIELLVDWGSFDVIGQVLDSAGTPVSGSKVLLTWSQLHGGLRSQSERETASDTAGFFRFAQVGPGMHMVRVTVPGFREARLQHNAGADPGNVVVRLERDTQTVLSR